MNDQQTKNAKAPKWTMEQDDLLRSLYAEGLPTAEIAERMGFGRKGKNRVVGRSHRLNLPRRQSSNRVPGPERKKATRPVPIGRGATLPPIASVEVTPPPLVEPLLAPIPAPEPVPVEAEGCEYRPATVITLRPLTACQWIHGDARARRIIWCDARAEIGRPYCTTHAELAYQRAG